MDTEDMMPIFNLISRLDRLATERKDQEYVVCFTEDGEIAGEEGTVKGRHQLATFVRSTWAKEQPGTIHVTANQEVVTLNAEEATAESILLLTTHEGRLLQVDRISHQLVKIDGQWLVQQRLIRF